MTLKIGDVFLIHNDEIYPPKKKLSICVCSTKNLFLLINSKDRIGYECVTVKNLDYSFLKHDSFVSCSRVFTHNTSIIKKSKPIGSLSANDLRRIKERVMNSDVLSKKDIELIIKNLSALT